MGVETCITPLSPSVAAGGVGAVAIRQDANQSISLSSVPFDVAEEYGGDLQPTTKARTTLPFTVACAQDGFE